ncbi:alpha-amylase family protein [Paenibacillus humicola]|uniref:alpha-amylase family protein n=1 Tax=Paenibacillus humicola TaxID=3110540 RepID=UPI00237BDFBC|nr:alpha-amylase family protein [Paenibacillus humicola]
MTTESKSGRQPIEEAQSPWYRRTRRWGQTNLTEMDPQDWDKEWWKSYWKQTRVQGVIVNAGGIVAYYPSAMKLQYRAQGLGDRDLFGEFTAEARKAGLAVLARMDINRATRDFYDAHPDWFVVDADGRPVQSNGRYFSCVNSGYYKEYIPQVLREIIERYKPEGFTDNSWTGASRSIICHCVNCRTQFMAATGHDLPAASDYNDPVYRKWIKWSYGCRIANWDLFNRVTREHGGPDCLWLGMFNADPFRPHTAFCDLKEVGERSKMMMCDHQSREPLTGFEQNAQNGFLLHSLAGWDIVIPESMSNYVRGLRTFRQGSNPPAETRMWMIEGIAGGISPWYHHIGARHEDRRQFENAPPVMQWHAENERYLYDRRPVATVGLVWSQENTEFYGRDRVEERVALPWRGFVQALTRARIAYMPVHADHIAREAAGLDVLILPDLAVLTDSQGEAIKAFVESGGSLIATGASGTLDEWGEPRQQFPLQQLTGLRPREHAPGSVSNASGSWENDEAHNYFRLPDERHPVLERFTDTAILPFGGRMRRFDSDGRLEAVATYIPSYPIYPPEFSWMREPRTDIPSLFAGDHSAGGRIVYFAGDVDRIYGLTRLPDLGDLLAEAVKWAAADRFPLRVEGPGYLDCKLYAQEGRRILHLVNLTGANANPGYMEEVLPVGPIEAAIRVDGDAPQRALLRVGGKELKPVLEDGWAKIRIDSVAMHEMIVLD